jgi:hypothetical protein
MAGAKSRGLAETLSSKPGRILKIAASFVLASLGGLIYDTEYASPLRSLRPCLG